MRVMKKLVGGLLIMAATTVNAAINFVPSSDNLFVANTGKVSALFLGSDATMQSDLFLVGNPTPLFNNQTSSFMDEVSANFTAGTELSFALFVKNTAKVYLSGSASNNLDNQLHFSFFDLGNDNVLVGVEDSWQGGDKDYNDFVFVVRNVRIGAVPEPELYASMLLGLGVVAGVSRRRKQ